MCISAGIGSVLKDDTLEKMFSLEKIRKHLIDHEVNTLADFVAINNYICSTNKHKKDFIDSLSVYYDKTERVEVLKQMFAAYYSVVKTLNLNLSFTNVGLLFIENSKDTLEICKQVGLDFEKVKEFYFS